VTTSYETREHDVLIIGAGGAGLRAAIEALAKGASVGVVCKSLLGKAHTVMAEGGIAAAMANVDAPDNWKTHFRDTMRGGKFLNDWRMAQLHAQESPDRVRELEQWGALFDRTETGDILQRAFGGHTFKRLCHVGDRTGLEMIRTLQDRGVQQGIDVYMECTVTRLLTDGGRVEFGSSGIGVLHTPGHSPGSVTFVGDGVAPLILTGDTLFAGSIGRTDLWGGSFDAIIASIRSQLLTLPDECAVICGHGPMTTIGRERTTNPFLTEI